MQVDMTVTFTREEILEMCAEKVAKIETVVPGKFTVRHKSIYGPEVIAEFVPASEEAKQEDLKVPVAA